MIVVADHTHTRGAWCCCDYSEETGIKDLASGTEQEMREYAANLGEFTVVIYCPVCTDRRMANGWMPMKCDHCHDIGVVEQPQASNVTNPRPPATLRQ